MPRRNMLLVLSLIAVALHAVADLTTHASLSDDGKSLSVSFSFNNKTCAYNLSEASIFAIDANISMHTEEGVKQLSPPPSRVFISREPGMFATAMMDDIGSRVATEGSGLFICKGALIDIPSFAQSRRLGKTVYAPHLTSLTSFHQMALTSPLRGGRRLAGTIFSEDEPIVANESGDWEEPVIAHQVSIDTWHGETWYPGCYCGDEELHIFKVGIIADVAAHEKHGNDLVPLIQTTVAKASLIYESQMNIRLEIGDMQLHAIKTEFTPDYANGECTGYPGQEGISTQLMQLAREEHSLEVSNGALHLFTGCGNGLGYVGLGNMNKMCQQFDTSVVELHDDKAWLIFAHELGHNFGANHSFEDGKGKTGGIMDYNNHMVHGEYQFNTKYRKEEMCKTLDSAVYFCGNLFTPLTKNTHCWKSPVEQIKDLFLSGSIASTRGALVWLLAVMVASLSSSRKH